MNFVIVGTGNIARTYLAAIGKMPDVNVAGFRSRSGRRPEFAHDSHESTRFRREGRRIRRRYPRQAAGLHHRGTIAAAQLGKHVLTEKPLDISVESTDAMIEACRANHVKLGVAYQRRMSPDNRAVKKLPEEEAFFARVCRRRS